MYKTILVHQKLRLQQHRGPSGVCWPFACHSNLCAFLLSLWNCSLCSLLMKGAPKPLGGRRLFLLGASRDSEPRAGGFLLKPYCATALWLILRHGTASHRKVSQGWGAWNERTNPFPLSCVFFWDLKSWNKTAKHNYWKTVHPFPSVLQEYVVLEGWVFPVCQPISLILLSLKRESEHFRV